MHKNIFLFSVLFLLSSCAERGYELTTNATTHTVILENCERVTQNEDTPLKLKKMEKLLKTKLETKSSEETDNEPVKNIVLKNSTQKTDSSEADSTETDSTDEEKSTEIRYDNELVSSTTDLIFKRVDKAYQEYGNSEIHGHVIYLTSTGMETRLKNTHIYLLESSKKLNDWYNNAYLTNTNNRQNSPVVEYVNTTYLNLSKNFALHGIQSGDYFVIIVSDTPDSEKENSKVYIAKKIKVEKRKKIMAVFSKKL